MALKVDNARSKVVASKFTVIITISIVAAISNTASVPIRTADLNSRRRIRTDKPASMGSRAVGQLRRLPNRSYINHGVLGFKDGGIFLAYFVSCVWAGSLRELDAKNTMAPFLIFDGL